MADHQFVSVPNSCLVFYLFLSGHFLVNTLAQKRRSQSSWNFPSSCPIIRSRQRTLSHRDHSSVTSSRRHFVKSYDWAYLHNAKLFLNQIWYTLISGQGSTFKCTRMRARAMTYAYARVKILKCSKWLHFKFTTRFRPFWAFQKFPRVRVRARIFARVARTESWNAVFLHVLGF